MHTKYSLLDSTIEPKKLIKKVISQNKKVICITEHGNLYSSIEVYKLCQENDIKYLHGCEMYICDNVLEKDKNSKYYHLILISKNEKGRQNLINLVSRSNQHKYYGKPRIDFNLLEKYKDGLIVLSACMAGEVQRCLINENKNAAKRVAEKYKSIFCDDYYLEYQSHSESTQQKLNRMIVDLANELGIKYVVTTDAHYIEKEEQKYHNIFVQIGQSREVGETYNDCYLQSEDEIFQICKSTTYEENLVALKNTQEIADKCNVVIPLSPPIMPHEPVPDKYKSEISYLKHICAKGWISRKINTLSKEVQKNYRDRLLYEIDAILKMGFEGYYLLVWGYANSVKRRGIARGSGGGSLVAYLMSIVDTDPIKYGLYFERFIDVGALELLDQGIITKSQLKTPDFDLDFGKEDRERVVEFVVEKYGQERVAALGSFQYIWAKGAIKDIGKVLNIPFEITNEMTSKLDKETIQEVLDLGLLDSYKEEYESLFEYAEKLAGLPKSFSAHPCGKVVCMQPVNYYNATDINDSGDVILQGDMHTAEDLGLIKADFLGLRTVDVIYDTLEMIGKDYEYIAPHNINFEDKKVFENFRSGNTFGVFQFESDGMKSTLKEIECNSLYDLTVANALYRPGSMAYIQNYADRRKGLEDYEFLHDDLKHILNDSYGIIIFQEQLIEIGRLAGLKNPDELRQATAKKKPKLLDKIKPELFEGLKLRGWSVERVEVLWDTMLDFAKYSFNKSHALAYAMIAYICMYLKIHHPKEFMCCLLNSYNADSKKISKCINEMHRLNIKLYDIEFGKCNGLTSLYKDVIMLGTASIKNCNKNNAIELQSLSKNSYNSIVDLFVDIKNNTGINSRQLITLIGLRMFNAFGKNQYVETVSNLIDKLYERKDFSKTDIEKHGLNAELLAKHSSKVTPKKYCGVNMLAYIREFVALIEDKDFSIKKQISHEMDCLETPISVYSKSPENIYYVIESKVYKDKSKPYLKLYCLRTGEVLKTKITNGSKFSLNPFKNGNVINVTNFREQYKSKKINGSWQKTNEIELVLDEWEVY